MVARIVEILGSGKIEEVQRNTKILIEKTEELTETLRELIKVLKAHGKLTKELSDALSQAG